MNKFNWKRPQKPSHIIGLIVLGFFLSVVLLFYSNSVKSALPAGYFLNFGGNDYMNLGNVLDNNGTAPMTISAWARTTSISNGVVVSKQLKTSPYSGYSLVINTSGLVEFSIQANTTNRIRVTGTTLVNNGQWHQLAATYDGGRLASGVRLYIDGVQATVNINNNNFVSGSSSSTSATLNVGSKNNGGSTFIGSIDEVRIFNRVLDQSEIQSTMDDEISGSTSGLVGYWRFNEGSGQVANDSSPSAFNGILGSSESPDGTDPSWDQASSPSPNPDPNPPSVSITNPFGGSIVWNTTTVSADASDDIGVVGVQFKLDGNNLGIEDTVAPFSIIWDTHISPNGPHTLTAVARDATGNSTTSAPISVTVDNIADSTIPIISNVQVTNVSSSGATITWNTDEPATSQVEYGLTSSYGSLIPIDSNLVTAHAVTLSGLSANTMYHFQVRSKDSSNNEAILGDFTFTTSSPSVATCTRFFFYSQAAEALFGSQTQDININSEPVQILGPNVEYQWRSGGGVQRWQDPNNDAWTQPVQHPCPAGATMTKAALFVTINDYLDVQDPEQPFGQFHLTFRQQVEAWIQNVRNKYPTVQRIWLTPVIDTQGDLICVHPKDGQRVRASVNHPIIRRYLQDIVESDPAVRMGGIYTIPECAGYSDSIGHLVSAYRAEPGRNIANFYLNALASTDAVPPTISIDLPTNGSTVSGTVTVSATASDNVGVSAVQFYLDNKVLNIEDTSAPHSVTWDTTTVSNGTHTLKARARDAAGNQVTSVIVTVTVQN